MSAEAGAWSEDLAPWGVTNWELPGQGDRGPRCGEWYAEAVCDTCGHLDLATHMCGRRECPDCWGSWAKEAAVRATHRIQAFRYTQPDDYHRQAARATVSPPQGEIETKEEFYNGKSKAAEIAKRKGFRGFLIIAHPFRVTEKGKQRYNAEDPDYGIWVWLRNDIDDLEEYIYWSPHYHIAGPTSADMEEAQESDEWVYKFIGSFDRFDGVRDRDSHESVYGHIRYLLSHTGYPAGSTRQAVTWYGDLANSVFVEEAKQEWQIQKPSEGIRSVLKREIEAIAGPTEDEEEGGEAVGVDDKGRCPIDECEGVLIGVFDVSMYLEGTDPPPEVRERMQAARDWRLGRKEPPPGMKRPQTEEQAREALEHLIE